MRAIPLDLFASPPRIRLPELTGSEASFLTGGMKRFAGCLPKGGNIVIHLK